MANTNNSDPALVSELHSRKSADMVVDSRSPDTDNPISGNRSGGPSTPRFEVVIPASLSSTRSLSSIAASVGSVEGKALLAPTTVRGLQDRVVPPVPSHEAGIPINSLHGGALRQSANTEHTMPDCSPQTALTQSKCDYSIPLTEALVSAVSHYAHSTFASDAGYSQRGVEHSYRPIREGSSEPILNGGVDTDGKSGAPGWGFQINGESEHAASNPNQRQHYKQRNPPGNNDVLEAPPRPPSTNSSPPYSPPPAFPEEVESHPIGSEHCLPRPVSGDFQLRACRHNHIPKESKEHRSDIS